MAEGEVTRPTFHEWAFGEAAHAARRSKDPSTRVGAAIFRPDGTLASKGYNGFPRGVGDDPARLADRPTRYLMTVHAEANAIVTAREPLHGHTIFSTFFPCAACAGLIIQSGISCVVAPEPAKELRERWAASIEAAETMFREAGVQTVRCGPSYPLTAPI